jgi:diguanylate cyclase (GGDEF)-like protein
MAGVKQRTPKFGLLATTAGLAALVWVVGGVVIAIMLQQQTRIENDAQHIYDVSSAKVFEATRTIRGLERLAREGDALCWINDLDERAARRQRMQSLIDDAALQGDPKLRALVQQAFKVLDENLQALYLDGTKAQSEIVARWEPVMLALLSQSEEVGAEVSALALQEADHIMLSTDSARNTLFIVAAAVGAGSLALFGFVYIALTRPVVRLARSLNSARQGTPIPEDEEMISELQMLHDAAVALGGAHRELETVRDQLELLAHTDALTDLANRRMFELRSTQAFAHARRYGEILALIAFDIDHFKRINDRFGHEGGDYVLIDLGRYLHETIREADYPVARIGGEEFALLLEHGPGRDAAQVAERLRNGIEALEVKLPGGEVLQFTASFGVAVCTKQDRDLHALMRRADLALYAAKQAGRNRVELAA